MKFHAEVGDQKHEVEIKREGGKLFAQVDDRPYELDVSEPEPGIYLFKYDGRVFEASVSDGHVRIGGNEFDIRLVDPKRLRGGGTDHDHADGIAEIKTAMPGKVVRVLVEAGTEVEKGDGVVVVEAMKMQNELKSPKAGIVKEIRTQEGATVGAGDILATIE
ncbi:MAG TPA: biotin/lipoyl-containing protein [Pyrinomonadaceae bacterium]|nr:biotin/lipoyl-containing protein [Pyrinomonadaceae bacterium]